MQLSSLVEDLRALETFFAAADTSKDGAVNRVELLRKQKDAPLHRRLSQDIFENAVARLGGRAPKDEALQAAQKKQLTDVFKQMRRDITRADKNKNKDLDAKEQRTLLMQSPLAADLLTRRLMPTYVRSDIGRNTRVHRIAAPRTLVADDLGFAKAAFTEVAKARGLTLDPSTAPVALNEMSAKLGLSEEPRELLDYIRLCSGGAEPVIVHGLGVDSSGQTSNLFAIKAKDKITVLTIAQAR